MTKHLYIFFIILYSIHNHAAAQCTTLGQTPETAFPVCGINTFKQQNVPICGNTDLVVPGCSGRQSSADYQNKNPFFYKFTCYATGTLGFLITPNDLGDDYDWQLYDITNHSPAEIYTNQSLVVTGNWAGTYGATGTRNGGSNYIECASDPRKNKSSFAAMPTLVAGHNYILLISHFTDSQSGYSLSFGGGTANITDPKLPLLSSAEPVCDGTQIRIFLNKKMKCNSLALDGSDFLINTNTSAVIAAQSRQCNTGFDLDSLLLTLSKPLAPGDYKIFIKRSASDGNTLLDNCDREIPVNDSLLFTIKKLEPTPLDSITKLKCAPQTLELVFQKNIRCSSIAADGSDFVLSTGPQPVRITGASGANCTDGVSKKIIVQLSAPLQVAGTYRITLQPGADGSTIIDECGQQTPEGQSLDFAVADTVNADFTKSTSYSCEKDIIQYNYRQRNGVNTWQWSFDTSGLSTLQNPVVAYTDFRPTYAQLIVSNGVCSDTTRQSIIFDNYILALFDITNTVCPDEPATITNNTIGRIVQWNWTFSNGATSTLKAPPPQVFTPLAASNYFATAQLIAKNDYGCYDTLKRPVKVVFSCYIAVPTAFTPNGDGLNDYLYPLSAYKATNLNFSVYNRFGQRIFFSNNWQQKWDGRYKGQLADAGTYVWMLSYFNLETNRQVHLKGTSVLIK